MDSIKTTGGSFNVKQAIKTFVPKALKAGIKTGGKAIKLTSGTVRSVSRPVRFSSRQVRNVRKLDKELQNNANVSTAAAATASHHGTNFFRGQYRLMRRYIVSKIRNAISRTIKAASGAKLIAEFGAWVLRRIASLIMSMGVPAVCILLVAMLLLGFSGLSAANTTFGGLISMPFEYTDIVVTDEYGVRWHPVYERYALHTGIDFGTPHYCTVMAAQSGTVIRSADWNDGFGNCIVIEHNINGMRFFTLYAHLSQILVKAGDYVLMGQPIGIEGGSEEDPGHGTSTGHHLHFEYWNSDGVAEDPRIYLNYWLHQL